MNIISRIAAGAFIDAPKEVWDFANKEVLTEIKSQFAELQRPSLFDGMPNARILQDWSNIAPHKENFPC